MTKGDPMLSAIDQAIGLLTKSEAQLPPNKRKLLAQHQATIKNAMDGWEQELREATKEILSVAARHRKS